MTHKVVTGDIIDYNGRLFNVSRGEISMKKETRAVVVVADFNFVLDCVAEVYGIRKEVILGRCRMRHIVEARRAVCYHAYKYTGLTTIEIGELINLNHSSVTHHKAEYFRMMETDPKVRLYHQTLTRMIKERNDNFGE